MTSATMAEAPPSLAVSKQFRPEIEGVRSIAALLVAAYHVWSGRVSGGVDVFFVMSGFLITNTLIGQMNSSGRIKPLAFLGRLALRLLPAALTTLIAVLVASWVLLPDLLWQRIGHEVRASALYSENWYLAATKTNYLGQWEDKTPVEHFWALSLQGQFYLVWVALFLMAAALVKRYPDRAVHIVVGALGAVFAISLPFSIWFTSVNQPVAYFATPARGWEFALGGLAALALRRPPQDRSRLRWVLGWIGLAILLSTGLVLQVSTVFPGYAALLPTSAALMILLSANNGIGGGADSLLSHRSLVWLGGISYGIYLWHYPVLVFERSLRDSGEDSLVGGVAIILAAVVLAWLTQRFVERPVLAFSRRSAEAKRIVIGGLLAVLVAVAVGSTVFAADQTRPATIGQFEQQALQLSATAFDLEPCTGALAGPPGVHPECSEEEVSKLVPPANLVPATQKAVPCEKIYRQDYLLVCDGGSDDPVATAMLFGDSHSITMRPALDLVAKHHGWRLLWAYSPGCQTAASPKTGPTAERCDAWLQEFTDFVTDGPVKVDILFDIQASGRDLVGVTEQNRAEESAASYREQWDRYAGSVKDLVVIRDTPAMSDTVLTCIARHQPSEAALGCSKARTAALRPDYAALAAEGDDDPRTRVVDLSDVFCDDERCYPVIGGFIAYRDAVHLHTLFSRTLASVLEREIRAAIDDPALDGSLFATPRRGVS